ncbi:hypothetical protein HNR12_002187 [Streptomonospora nanhaiensis]|uniref:Uncharacterized protein n=1 Tax=Streptomonospora nanhaiensis TaxID=1323731 RepID=A0A853BLP5_9ACTN|nr:hypothetical protein [Streptomonospora nanhaiensis]NYI95910.1 hypothetical protein [Streptomonospora nanhaiensis]
MTTPTASEELVRLRERLERREDRARVRADVRIKRIRRRAELAGALARTRHTVAGSGEARAQRVASTRTVALAVLVPVLIAFGGWSAAGVQAGMVAMLGLDPDSPAALAAWLVEPGLLGLVVGVILIRARLQSAGGDLDSRATRIEWAALSTSIVLNMAGHWPSTLDSAALASLAGHALGPLGAAGTAYLISVVQDGVAAADPWTLPDGTPAPSLSSTPESASESPSGAASQSAREVVPPALEWVRAPQGARLLPLVARPHRKTITASAKSTSESPRRSTSEQGRQPSSEEAPEPAAKRPQKPRADRGTTLPPALKSTPPPRPRQLSDEDLADLLDAAIADARLDREPSVSAVQKCLGVGFERAKRVLALREERTETLALAAVPAARDDAA